MTGARLLRRLVVSIAALLVMAPTRPASAHAQIDATTPAANSVLEAPPVEIRIDFDAEVEVDLASIQLFASSAREVDLGVVRHGADRTELVAAVPQIGDGLYAVVWRATSTDGHVVEGGFAFTVGTSAAGDGQALLAAVRSGVGGSTAWQGLSTAMRTLSYLALVGVIGVGWWLGSGGAHPIVGRFGRRVPRWSAVVLVLSAMANFAISGARAVGGSWRSFLDASVWVDLAGTRSGALLVGRVLLGVVWIVLLRPSRVAQRTDPVTAVLALCTVVTFSGGGHAAAASPASLWVAVGALHLTAMSMWLGGLVVLTCVGRAAMGDEAGSVLTGRVSRVATLAVPLAVVSGASLAIGLGEGWVGVRETGWGRVLVAKVLTVGVMLLVAAAARFVLHRRSSRALWGTVALEAAIGVVVVALAAGVAVRSPEPVRPARPYAEQLAAPSGLIAIVSLSPGSIGTNEVHIVATPPGGSLQPVEGITARISLRGPAGEVVVPASPVSLRDEGINHVSGTVVLPRSGEWTLEVLVQVTATEVQVLDGTVSIP